MKSQVDKIFFPENKQNKIDKTSGITELSANDHRKIASVLIITNKAILSIPEPSVS